MTKFYEELSDTVSLLVYCTTDKSFLLLKENCGELWLPSSKSEKSSWKVTVHKISIELFGMELSSPCRPLRVTKMWLPDRSSIYHAVYLITIRADNKKRMKIKQGVRHRLHWFAEYEVDRHLAHNSLRSPELALFTRMASGDTPPSALSDMETLQLVEICEENVMVGVQAAGGAAAVASPTSQLLQAANYSKENQIRLYREFMVMVFPAVYMSLDVFTQFMVDLGWQRPLCVNLFRSADVNARGGLSFCELMMWSAAIEPVIHHSGVPAEIRCRYIFRYFDNDRDQKLEYTELKELVAAARAARQLPLDSISVTKDADAFLKQLGIQEHGQLSLNDFMRGVGELRIRGTSSMLRAPRSVIGYVIDLQGRQQFEKSSPTTKPTMQEETSTEVQVKQSRKGEHAGKEVCHLEQTSSKVGLRPLDYTVAACVVRVRRNTLPEVLELNSFEEDAVSVSTIKLMTRSFNSLKVLGVHSIPVDILATLHHFSAAGQNGAENCNIQQKAAWSWSHPSEEEALGKSLLTLADAVRPLIASEPRLLQLNSPVYAVGDLHGNLAALLEMEATLWPSGPAFLPAKLLFLGDYVDRGPHGVELMAYLLAAKLQRPNGVYLVRGNHETRELQKMYTFYNECITKFGEVEGVKVWDAINLVFDVLPLAALVDDKVFCCHGGIPPPWVCRLIWSIDKVPVSLPRPNQSAVAWELLWNDPVRGHKITSSMATELAANEGFAVNKRRGTGHVFSQPALERFLLDNRLALVVRAHELQRTGFMCNFRGRLISVFSSSRYCGGTNDSGVALLEDGKLRLIRVSD